MNVLGHDKLDGEAMTAGNFSSQAAAYKRARPGYPESLLDKLVAEASVQAGDAVVDFGAGTGILTRMLVARSFNVSAVDPSPDMMRRADLPGVKWVRGTFEDNPLPNESQSWAVTAQAFHWANLQVALPEVRRVLQPHSVFTVLWNDRVNQDSEVLQWTVEAIRRHVPEFDQAYRNRPCGELLESTGDFTFLSHIVVRHVITMSKGRYLDLWRSHNSLNSMAGPNRFAVFFDDLTEHLQQRKIEQIDVPYSCEAWSARRDD